MNASAFIRSVLAAGAVVIASLWRAAPDAQAILAASDAVRNPSKPFAVVATLIEYRSGKQTDGNTLSVYSKADPHSGHGSSQMPGPRCCAPRAGRLRRSGAVAMVARTDSSVSPHTPMPTRSLWRSATAGSMC